MNNNMELDYTWEQILRFLHSHKNYKVKPIPSPGWDLSEYYNKNDYYEYTIDKGETTVPAVDVGQATYCSYVDTCARFPRVEVIKFETFTAAALVCALGLWLLGKLFFR